MLVVFFGLIAYRIIIGFSPVVSTRPVLVFCSSSSRIGENGHESTLWGLEKRDLMEGLHMEGQREREREREREKKNTVVVVVSSTAATPRFFFLKVRTSRTPSSRRPEPPRARERASVTLASPGPPFSGPREGRDRDPGSLPLGMPWEKKSGERLSLDASPIQKKTRPSASIENNKGKALSVLLSIPLRLLLSTAAAPHDKHGHGVDAAGEQGRGR